MNEFNAIKRRHALAVSGFQACTKYHTERKNPDILDQSTEYTIHRDRGWLINRVLELEGKAPEPPHDYVKDGILTPESVRELEGYIKDA